MLARMTIESHLLRFLKARTPDVFDQERVAIAVSGGGDSMALSYALSQLLPEQEIHFLTVDHGLRPEAAEEALAVKGWVSGVGVHETLVWEHDGLDSKVQEDARQARYDLMLDYCEKHNIQTLFVGHHQDDLIETFLMRLSSGSGVDGLSSIAPVSHMREIMIVRPFYEESHEDLLAYCREQDVAWIEDPSNDQDKYKRVRFRKAQEFLEEEGLTARRLSKTIERMVRVREALDGTTQSILSDISLESEDNTYQMDLAKFYALHAEFKIRVLSLIIQKMTGNTGYPPRLEKLEGVAFDVVREKSFRKRTFAGCLFEVKLKDNVFLITLENR